MTIEEIEKLIPKEFIIANHIIEIEIQEQVFDYNKTPLYGLWESALGRISIARTIQTEKGPLVELSEEQILNTFMHELIHCFMFFTGVQQDEMIAQTFANCLREYEVTKTFV